MNQPDQSSPISPATRWVFLIIGLVAGAVAIAGLFTSGTVQFFQSYIFAYMFWIGLSLGSLALVMLYYVAGGRWAGKVQWITGAGARTILLMLVLFIPIVLNLPVIYKWAQPQAVAASQVLQHQSIYLNTPFFLIRAVVFFAIWIALAFIITRLTRNPGSQTDPALFFRLRKLSTVGLILYILTMSFAAFDWVMSLQAGWYSSIFGLVLIMAQGLTSVAFATIVLGLVLRGKGLPVNYSTHSGSQTFRDIGAVMLAFVIGWAYMSFFQFLIIWAANIAEEAVWYVNRLNGGWESVALLIVIAQLALPFFSLLSMQARSNLKVLMAIATLLFAINWVTLFWIVMPSFYPGVFHLHWLDFILPIAMGGLWLFVFAAQLKIPAGFSMEAGDVTDSPLEKVHG